MTKRLWTDDEIGFLIDNEGRDASEIADYLGRSRDSIYGMRVQLKKGHVSSKHPWTEDEDEFIVSNPGLKARQVASAIHRSPGAVAKRRQYLTGKYGVSFDMGNKNPTQPGDRRLLAKTCGGCGLLLEASWFGLIHNGHGKGWRNLCTKCRPRRSNQEPWRGVDTKKNRERLQAATLPTAVNHGNPWTESDHVILSDPDMSVLGKALRLGRTYYAVSSACADNGYRSVIGRGDPTKGQWIIAFQKSCELVA